MISSMNGAGDAPLKTAVLLHGLLRNFKVTSSSFLRHVVRPNDATIFYFGPAYTDLPEKVYSGLHDKRGFLAQNPKSAVDDIASIGEVDLASTYGPALAAAHFHGVDQSEFIKASLDILDREDWLFGMNPYRILSMYFNMEGAVRLMLKHEEETGHRFDRVIVARPDLAFYTPIAADVASDEVHLPCGEGILHDGHKPIGNAPIFFYKNALTGDYAPADRSIGFNDQLMILSREAVSLLATAFTDVTNLLAARAPASPETLLYLLLISRGRLKLVEHPEWVYEILRADAAPFRNVLDLPSLPEIDPYHPLVSDEQRARVLGA